MKYENKNKDNKITPVNFFLMCIRNGLCQIEILPTLPSRLLLVSWS